MSFWIRISPGVLRFLDVVPLPTFLPPMPRMLTCARDGYEPAGPRRGTSPPATSRSCSCRDVAYRAQPAHARGNRTPRKRDGSGRAVEVAPRTSPRPRRRRVPVGGTRAHSLSLSSLALRAATSAAPSADRPATDRALRWTPATPPRLRRRRLAALVAAAAAPRPLRIRKRRRRVGGSVAARFELVTKASAPGRGDAGGRREKQRRRAKLDAASRLSRLRVDRGIRHRDIPSGLLFSRLFLFLEANHGSPLERCAGGAATALKSLAARRSEPNARKQQKWT